IGSMTRPFISLTTDFGLRDPYAGICRGVIASIAPDAIVVDLSHEVAQFAIRDGALVLWSALPYLPVGVHVAVVDPGVGTERRPIGVRAGRGDVLVGPDNGLLLPALDRLGGLAEARLLGNRDLWRETVSASFHGRDIFSPVAAHIAAGTPFESVGPTIDPGSLVRLALPPVEARDGGVETGVVYIDTFGNVKLSALAADLVAALGPLDAGDALAIEIRDASRARRIELPWATTFGDRGVGEPLVYEDAYGRACIAVNRGSAADVLGLVEDVPVVVRRR
ncbi:MAG TPA: SAM-dependent chlorinase/fluorinase, partial [Candidatus Limnocylindrales bacterium]|nr:SAM-dependent chlorinase/fluorinase [Candidatus Limnocylindrales bacterium]